MLRRPVPGGPLTSPDLMRPSSSYSARAGYPRLRLNRPAILAIGAVTLLSLYYLFSTPPAPSPPLSSPSYDGYAKPGPRKVNPKRPSTGQSSRVSRPSSDGVDIDSRGLTSYVPGHTKMHPIELLIKRGKKLAAEMQAKIKDVHSLDDAVEDYERAFGMSPPRGFDYWYRFNRQAPSPKPVSLPSLIPWAHNSMLPFLSLPIDSLLERVDTVRPQTSVFSFTFVPDGEGDIGTACNEDEEWTPADWHTRGKGRVRVRGGGEWLWRCNNTLHLLLPLLPTFPPEMFTMDPPLELVFALDDGPRGMVHNTFRDRSEALGKAGKVWPKAQLYKAEQGMRWTYGWAWSCPEGTPLKTHNTDMVLNDLAPQQPLGPSDGIASSLGASKTFIADFAQSADFCNNPGLMPYHHILIMEQHRSAVPIVPVVAACRALWSSDILGVPLDAVFEQVDYVPWEGKSIDKVFWRGSATGAHHNKEVNWRQGQRERLHSFSHNETSGTHSLLLQDGSGVRTQEWSVKELNEKWLDVGLSGGPVQCSESDGSCQAMADEITFMGRVKKEDGVKYKFVIDVDGNGWSSRFRRLLAGNNVVLKSTLYPEWFHDQLIPWYHYVPLKLDYTDMYDILAFFMGAPDGSTPGRDDLAKEIGDQGLKFTQQRWRREDMQSYMYLLILEYWRVMSADRKEASYAAFSE